MKDVAKEAGVSLGTVSKVMNGLYVGSAYRKKVLEAADRLGYHMNYYAKVMRSGETATVAVILPHLQNQFFAALAQRLCESLRDRKRQMLLYIAQPGGEGELDCIHQAKTRRVDGVIAVTYNAQLSDVEGMRLVTIDRVISPDISCVSSDNYSGGQLAAQKLMELGCRSLLGIHIPCPAPSEPDKRIEGFRACCKTSGTPFAVRRESEEKEDDLFPFLESHLKPAGFEYDGIFCSNDDLACKVWTILKAHHVPVPEAVQIIGFDGVRHFEDRALMCSTIAQPVKEIADKAVELVLDEQSQPMLVCLPVKYQAGGTTREDTETWGC